ncbi:MAG: phenylalanine--tRNA ligase subunit beta [Acidobacteriota bacterium]
MIVSQKWLRNYVDCNLPVEDLAHRLTMAGLEVDALTPLYPHLKGVVTARLESFENHPKADRLHLCTVSSGGESYRVVCGATNLVAGSIVALALPGAEMANGMVVKEAQIRGQNSQGMLCSQKELGVGEDADGIWLLPAETQVGVPLSEAINADDMLIEIGITPNRGDCLSMIGVAREVSAICSSPLRYPDVTHPENGTSIESLSSVTIDDPVGCPRYAARIVKGVTIGPSPEWLREALSAVGIRSINNIVDVTNFVMMELGQPLHAFDFETLRERRIVVRRAAEGERFTTLDGVERKLFADTLLICDGMGPVAIAGIMGGLDSEITEKTHDVLIESAYFDPLCIRRSSKKLGLRSESSYRFERGIDPNGVVRALDRAAQLMAKLGGGEIVGGRIDNYPTKIEPLTLTLRVERTNRFLGRPLAASEMASLLRSIEMGVEETGADQLRVTVPTFRPDITREVDLSEEVARLSGYDDVPVTYPMAAMETAPMDPHMRARLDAKSALTAAGFFEVLTYSFISLDSLKKLRFAEGDPRLDPVRVKNPLSEEQGVMRTSLVPGLLQTVRHNFGHRNDDLRLFELSKVFLPRVGESLPAEPHHLTGIMTGRRSSDPLYGGEDLVDYADVKGVVEAVLDLFHLGEVRFEARDLPPYLDDCWAASIVHGGEIVGVLGRLHADVEESFDLKRPVFAFELYFDRLFAHSGARPMFSSLPKFPSVSRDMALIVEMGLSAREVLDFIADQREPLVESVEIFDIYRNPAMGEGKKSLGYRLVYRASDRSLTDEEVNGVHGGLVDKVLKKFQAVLR